MYPEKINLYLKKILPQSPALQRQFLPSEKELDGGGSKDPTDDRSHSPLPRLVHRHPDRVLILLTLECFAHCRFCFRKAFINHKDTLLQNTELDNIVNYLKENPAIREVILTGGDPLSAKNSDLKLVLQALSAIPTLDILRIHTRAPMINPKRIEKGLLKIFQSVGKPLFIVIHANHPDEFTKEAKASLQSLISLGIPLLSQSVLLKDVNDSVETMGALMRCFIKNKIKPYYLHHCDSAEGTGHFHVSIERGQEIMRELRRTLSGLCLPQYVLDIPGGYGKIPIESSYAQKNNQDWTLTDTAGSNHLY